MFYKTLLVNLYCFSPDADYVNSLACTFLDVFWSAGVRASCTCDFQVFELSIIEYFYNNNYYLLVTLLNISYCSYIYELIDNEYVIDFNDVIEVLNTPKPNVERRMIEI